VLELTIRRGSNVEASEYLSPFPLGSSAHPFHTLIGPHPKLLSKPHPHSLSVAISSKPLFLALVYIPHKSFFILVFPIPLSASPTSVAHLHSLHDSCLRSNLTPVCFYSLPPYTLLADPCTHGQIHRESRHSFQSKQVKMHKQLLAVLFAASAAVASPQASGLDLSGLSPCSQQIILAAINSSPCGTDITCVCKDTGFAGSLKSQIETQCGAADAQSPSFPSLFLSSLS
jgi:hypothetical protein